MKSMKSIFAALVLLASTSITSATEPVTDPALFVQASQEIAHLLGTPYFEVDEDISASISLVVNQDGELVVLDVVTDNSEVESFVKSRLNYHKITSVLDRGVEYEIPLKIKSQS